MADWIAFVGVLSLYTWNSRRQTRVDTQQAAEAYDIRVTDNCDDPPPILSSPKWTYHADLERFVRFCPKVELHVHFDGSLDPSTLYERLLQRDQALTCLPVSTQLPWEPTTYMPVRHLIQSCRSSQDLHKLCTCRGQGSLYEMLKCFLLLVPMVRGQYVLLEELAYDFVKRQAQQHIVYTELRYSPHLLSPHGDMVSTSNQKNPGNTSDISSGKSSLSMDADEVVNAVTRGLRRGCDEFHVRVQQIVCAIAWRPDWAMDVVRIAEERRQDYPCAVVGLDIAAGEEHFDEANFPDLHHAHLEAFQKAQELDLNITIHAGEVHEARNVETAIQQYGAKRIGHGYRLLEMPWLMERIPRNVHIEICPTSSLETGGWKRPGDSTATPWTKHPVVSFLRNSMLSVSLSSDDPAVFDTSLTWQWRIALGKMGLDKHELIAMNRNAIDAAFCNDAEKQRLHKLVTTYWERGQNTPPILLQQHSFTDRVGGTSRTEMEVC